MAKAFPITIINIFSTAQLRLFVGIVHKYMFGNQLTMDLLISIELDFEWQLLFALLIATKLEIIQKLHVTSNHESLSNLRLQT